jgi:Glycosyl hydrolase family 1
MPRPYGLLGVLTLVLALGTQAQAHAAHGMEVAVQDDAVLMGRLYGSASNTLKLVSRLRASRIRVNVSWSYVVGKAAKLRTAPKRINYNWTGYDALVRKAAAQGIRLQLTLTGPAPAYATANHRIGPYKPRASAFRAFATAAAEHFRGRVDRYSIWNEPNYVRWLSPLSRGPKLYRALYLAGHGAIKRADPSAKVLIGETSPFENRGRSTAPLKFLRGVTCATREYAAARICDTLEADGYAQHAYDPTHAPTYRYPGTDNVTLATLDRLTGALDDLAAEGLLTTPDGEPLDVYVTEYGFFASGKKRISAARHARYLVQAFKMAQANPRVRQMLQYLIVKPRGNYSHFDTSIADKHGRPALAFKKLAAWANAAFAAGRISPQRDPAHNSRASCRNHTCPYAAS